MSIQLRKLIGSRINELTSMKISPAGLLDLKQNINGKTGLKLIFKKHQYLRKLDVNWCELNSVDSKLIHKVTPEHDGIEFELDEHQLITDRFQNLLDVQVNEKPQKIIVEYSSPNIAKPFHMGHLRSAIIGNFLSNLLNVTNNQVTRMNYLGDYGTQFGFLRVGIEMEKLSDEDIRRNPLKSLFRAYVTANSSKDPEIAEKARRVFEMMEKDESEEIVQQWEQIKSYTMDELRTMYERLNIVFDVFEFESMYRKRETENVISLLSDKNLLHKEIDGKISISVGDRRVPIVKSDSTTLYLTRDVAAVLSRLNKYKMDKIYYVVDNGQNDHFTALKSIGKDLGLDENLIHHVKFGTIKGMSTRKGSVVFLKDILDEAKDLMFKKQQESSTTKVDLSQCGEEIADVLGSSAVIVNDLKQIRTRHYDFDWNKALQMNGDTGVKLQYTHCRLHSLELNCQFEEAKEIDPKLLHEPEAQRLIFELIRYPEVVLYCSESLESSGLVSYLFALCNTTSKALKTLPVIQCQDRTVGQQRLLLFNSARKVLKHGLEILGLKVLNKM